MFLEAAAPYELGDTPQFQPGTLYPAYVRGQAYLTAHNGTAAAAEFQKFLDHRCIVVNFPIGALAHLGLARAYALSGDSAKASAGYPASLNCVVVPALSDSGIFLDQREIETIIFR